MPQPFRYKINGERAVMQRVCELRRRAALEQREVRCAMGKLTTHVLNVAAGIPAAGVRVELHRIDAGSKTLLCTAQTDSDGRCPAPLLDGPEFSSGRYSLTFHVAAYFRSLGTPLREPPFLDAVVIDFGVSDAAQSHHVPLLVSPWSYSTYRGS